MENDVNLVNAFLLRNNHVALAIVSASNILEATDEFASVLGFDKKNLCNFPLEKIFRTPDLEHIVASIKKREGALYKDIEVSTSQGGVKVADLFLENLTYDGKEISVLHLVDMTKRAVFSSFYRMLSAINRSIIHNVDMEKFFEEICETLVKIKYLELVWALEFEENTIKVLAYSGISKHVEYAIKALENSLKIGSPAPIFSSISDGKIKIIKNVLDDEEIKPYREALLSQGFKSVCYIPVKKDGGYKCAVCLYSSIPYFFDDYIMPVLEEMQLDMNFFLSNLKELTFKTYFMKALNHLRIGFW